MLSYGTRLKYAFRSFFSLLDYGRIPEDVVEAVQKVVQSVIVDLAGDQLIKIGNRLKNDRLIAAALNEVE